MDLIGTNKLLINDRDNYVRGIDTGEILDADSSGRIRGMVYDADGNNIQEPTDSITINGVTTPYSTIKNRGFEEITKSCLLIRLTDSAFNLNRTRQDWKFFRIENTER